MSARRTAWKQQALALDPKCTLKLEQPNPYYDLKYWRIYDGGGALIGWSERQGESSMMAWMRAFYQLDARRYP